ncbi:MAG: hypothetical protein EHM34_06885 [Nitrosopumilales archaeon]|nr:MAG: hypothetical protein EHM34_06885 [Nitrosopumilales archaeon]
MSKNYNTFESNIILSVEIGEKDDLESVFNDTLETLKDMTDVAINEALDQAESVIKTRKY